MRAPAFCFTLLAFVFSLHLAWADRVLLLNTAQETAQARIDMLNQSDEIYVSYFSFGGDKTSMELLSLLQEAAKKGKKVHLLVDGIGEQSAGEIIRNLLFRGGGTGGHIPPAVLKQLIKDGVQVGIFHPLDLAEAYRLPRRMHDKLFIGVKKNPGAEDTVRVITGSRNIADQYFGRSDHPHRETDIFVEGSSARDSLAYYQELFKSDHVGRVQHLRTIKAAEVAAADEKLKAARARLDQNEYLDMSGENLVPPVNRRLRRPRFSLDSAREVADVRFFHDKIHNNLGSHRDIIRAINSAKVSIVIANPYVLLVPDIREALALAARPKEEGGHGVHVEIVTNSFSSNDSKEVQVAFDTWEVPILAKMGIDVSTVNGKNLLHKKVMIVDEELSYVGSFNLDYRSKFFQLEVGMLVKDKIVAAELLRETRKDFATATIVTKGGEIVVRSDCHGMFRRMVSWALASGNQL